MNRSACGSRKQAKPKIPVKPFRVKQTVLEADICGEETVIIFPDIGKGKEPQKQEIFAGTAHREQEEILSVNLQCLKLGKKRLIQMKYRCINIAAQQIGGQTARSQPGGSEKKNADGSDRQRFFCFIFDSSGIIHKNMSVLFLGQVQDNSLWI